MSNLSFIPYIGNGVTKEYGISFTGADMGYLRQTDVKVLVDGVQVSSTINPASPHLVILDEAPPVGSKIIVRREMPIDTPYADFSRGNNFGYRQVNNSFLQQLYLTQEILDGFKPDGYYEKQNLNLGGFKITDVGYATSDNDATTLVQVNNLIDAASNLDVHTEKIINYLELKIFQSPTDNGLTEIQTRTVNANEVYEVSKTSDNSLATIYSDAAGTTEIIQNGTDNKSTSAGVVEFYVENTFDELKIETESGVANFKNNVFIQQNVRENKISVFENVASLEADAKLKQGDTVYLKGFYSPNDGGSKFGTIVPHSTGVSNKAKYHDLPNGLQFEADVERGVSLRQCGVTGTGDETSAIEAAYSVGVPVIVDINCEGNPSIPPRKTSGTGFIKGIVTITGSGMIADLGELNCSSLVVDGYQILHLDKLYINGTGFSEHGIETKRNVSDVYINELFIKNAGGTTQYKSATSFQGTNGKKLQINFADIRDCGYSGLTSATVDATLDPDIYSYDEVVLGNIYVDGCGNSTNPAGDNQHHGCYLATANRITYGKIIITNHQRGYGIKFGSSVGRNMGHIQGGEIVIDGVSNGRGGITFTEAYKSFKVGTGLIHNTNTTHAQWIHSGTSGDTNFGSMQFSETDNVPNEISLDIKGNLNSLDISSCKFSGWSDGGIRRGISDVIFINEGVVIDKLVSHGTRVDTIANHYLHAKGSDEGVGAIIAEVSIVAPILQNCGGVFNVEYSSGSSADVQRGRITGIQAELGTLTNAWRLPARGRLQLEVRENTMKSGGTVVRLNDLSYSRMSNITQFDTTYWIDTLTGVSLVEDNFDMQFPDASLSDGYIGKVYHSGTWKDYGAIV